MAKASGTLVQQEILKLLREYNETLTVESEIFNSNVYSSATVMVQNSNASFLSELRTFNSHFQSFNDILSPVRYV